MSFLRNIASGLRGLLREKQVDRELNEELGRYLEMAAAEKMKQGMSRRDPQPNKHRLSWPNWDRAVPHARFQHGWQ